VCGTRFKKNSKMADTAGKPITCKVYLFVAHCVQFLVPTTPGPLRLLLIFFGFFFLPPFRPPSLGTVPSPPLPSLHRSFSLIAKVPLDQTRKFHSATVDLSSFWALVREGGSFLPKHKRLGWPQKPKKTVIVRLGFVLVLGRPNSPCRSKPSRSTLLKVHKGLLATLPF